MLTHNLGFPRIGVNRDLKKGLENFWKGELSEEELLCCGRDLRLRHWKLQAAEGIDLAFRIGRSETLSLKARRLGISRSVVVASPAYLADRGPPLEPADLAAHACIVDTNRRTPRRWLFHGTAGEVAVDVQGRFHVNSARAAAELAAAGMGIACAPRFAVTAALARGRLVTLLDRFGGEEAPVSAVYLEGRALPRKVRALIDFAAADLRLRDVL